MSTTCSPLQTLEIGLRHCRRGEWHRGLAVLRRLEPASAEGDMPGLFHSYLGHALARCERRYAEGLAACERGLAVGFYEPENYLNLAWVHLLARNRAAALEAIRRGLEIDPQHVALSALHLRLGTRRAPVLPFLARSHPLNRRLGMLRHARESRRDPVTD